MHLKSILNRIERQPGFVYGAMRFVGSGARLQLEIELRPRAHRRPRTERSQIVIQVALKFVEKDDSFGITESSKGRFIGWINHLGAEPFNFLNGVFQNPLKDAP